jgi:tetratricopeptide (TPR) repeat protein
VATGWADVGVRHASGWESIRLLQFSDGHTYFENAFAQNQSDREALFGQAIALLNVQPRTEGNIQQAQALLESLIEKNAGDTYGLAARFFLARVELMHAEPADRPRAITRLLALADEAPQSVWGELALLKAAPFLLYGNMSEEKRREALHDLEKRGARLTREEIRRPLFLTLAQACFHYDLEPERALSYLMAADVDRVQRWQRRADAYVQIGNLARETGDLALARTYFQKFYDEFPRDSRHYMVGKILQELPGNEEVAP